MGPFHRHLFTMGGAQSIVSYCWTSITDLSFVRSFSVFLQGIGYFVNTVCDAFLRQKEDQIMSCNNPRASAKYVGLGKDEQSIEVKRQEAGQQLSRSDKAKMDALLDDHRV